MFDLDFRSREPIYEQIKKQIIRLAVTGVLKPDEKLPAVRQVAMELNVNPNTVQKAYQQLDAAGVIYSLPGKGSFVASSQETDEYARSQLEKELERVVIHALENAWSAEEILRLVDEITKRWRGEKQ